MANGRKIEVDSGADSAILKKLLILELFKLGATQSQIAKKLQMSTKGVNTFLKGIKQLS
jgi:DNA-binding CsgD family transcriptional regulator